MNPIPDPQIEAQEGQRDGTGRTIRLQRVPNVTAAFGMPVQAWDLHIGAQLKVLGRLVTLNSASLETTQWLEGKAVALGKLKGSLLATLKKYNTAARPAAQASVYGLKRVNRHGRAELQPGTMSLRVCIDASKKLIEEVGKYRPSVAAENLKILEGIISLG